MFDLGMMSDTLASLFHSTRKDVWVKFVPTEVFPLLNRELHCYHVLEFAESGVPIYANNSPEHPFVYGIRETLDDVTQARTALAMVLELLHRLYDSNTANTELQSTVEAISPREDPVLSSSTDAERIFRRLSVFNDTSELDALLARMSVNVHLQIGVNIRSVGSDWRNAATFFSRAYNERARVRDIIDRITYGVIGGGFRLSVPSEMARRFLERRLAGMLITRITAQSIRDSHLFGTSCFVIDSNSDLSIRLIRPSSLDIRCEGGNVCIADIVTGEKWQLENQNVAVMTGISQHSSYFGLSVLEPALATLVTIFRLSSIINEIVDRADITDYSFVHQSALTLRLADSHIQMAERRLETLFSFPLDSLPLDRTDLYLPGWEIMA